jgi:hypothetical protein
MFLTHSAIACTNPIGELAMTNLSVFEFGENQIRIVGTPDQSVAIANSDEG